MEIITRNTIAELIYNNLKSQEQLLKKQFSDSQNGIGYFFLDDVLPVEIALKIHEAFPNSTEMVLKKSFGENKFIAAQMDKYNPILEEIIYAFQEPKIVNLIAEICNAKNIFPDSSLYAGGISMMGHKQFLNPHLDNSHDSDRKRWRVLNLLYYVTPNWQEEYGGNLELWPNGLNDKQTTIYSKFNRLAVMATHNKSLHSVSPVIYDGFRCCVSNYYFSEKPLLESDTFHVTSFRGRPEAKLTDVFLKIDTFLRMNLRKVFKKGIKENPHYYKKK